MKINLKKSAAIIEALQVKSSHVLCNDVAQVGEHDDVVEVVTAAKQKLHKNKDLALQILETIYSIRRKVDSVNRNIGVSDVLNEIALSNRKISILEIFSSEDRVEINVESLKVRVDRISQQSATTGYNPNTKIATYLHTVESIEAAKAEKLALSRKVIQLKDNLLAMNVSNFIELSENEVVLLETLGLI